MRQFSRKLVTFYLVLELLLTAAAVMMAPALAETEPSTPEAQKIFKAHGASIYQIKVIDLASEKKSSIGSGFQFTREGHIATNYHVVAEAIQRPDQYRVEFLAEDESTGPLEILGADVVHDLAVVKRKPAEDSHHLALGTSDLPKGARLFALGNPHDIGFTIIEGTYNGLMEKTMYEKIHFSGSLNPGMSGGPALDQKGNVVGVNVMTSGNQISFLVPVEYLEALYTGWQAEHEEKGSVDFLATATERIGQQLLDNQNRYMSGLIKGDWESASFKPLKVPGEISDVFKCWSDQNNEEEDGYKENYFSCSSGDRLYLDREFTTGPIVYYYDRVTVDPDTMPLSRFYSIYETVFRSPLYKLYHNAGERDVGNFECDTSFVDLSGHTWKASTCVRNYKKYPKLFDVHLYMGVTGEGYQALTAAVVMQGVSQEQSQAFIGKFMNQVSWNGGTDG